MKRICAHLGRRDAVQLSLGLLAAAATQPATAQTKLQNVDLRLDWSLTGYQLPYYWAAKKGFYRDEGTQR